MEKSPLYNTDTFICTVVKMLLKYLLAGNLHSHWLVYFTHAYQKALILFNTKDSGAIHNQSHTFLFDFFICFYELFLK
jgi:hypothetical protein